MMLWTPCQETGLRGFLHYTLPALLKFSGVAKRRKQYSIWNLGLKLTEKWQNWDPNEFDRILCIFARKIDLATFQNFPGWGKRRKSWFLFVRVTASLRLNISASFGIQVRNMGCKITAMVDLYQADHGFEVLWAFVYDISSKSVSGRLSLPKWDNFCILSQKSHRDLNFGWKVCKRHVNI